MTDQDLTHQLLTALTNSTTDFRVAASLAEEFDVPVQDIRRVAEQLIQQGKVRHPYSTAHPVYRDWYALASKPPTFREKLLRLKAMIGREPI